eukprot:g43255.t1
MGISQLSLLDGFERPLTRSHLSGDVAATEHFFTVPQTLSAGTGRSNRKRPQDQPRECLEIEEDKTPEEFLIPDNKRCEGIWDPARRGCPVPPPHLVEISMKGLDHLM